MSSFFKQTKLDRLLKLNIADQMIITKIGEKSFDEITLLNNINTNVELDFIIKLAHHNIKFEELCKKEMHNSLWNGLQTLLGLYISANENNAVPFFEHDNICGFDMFRGLYFFHLAQREKIIANTDFSFSERELLKTAIKFGSIHATQRYHQFIFLTITNILTITEKEALLKEVILNCKALLPSYGSYAYMMLADAYIHYAQWTIADNVKNAELAVKAAHQACELAEHYLVKSANSIHNASLGNGLKRSNSYELSSPKAAKEFIENWWGEQKVSNRNDVAGQKMKPC